MRCALLLETVSCSPAFDPNAPPITTPLAICTGRHSPAVPRRCWSTRCERNDTPASRSWPKSTAASSRTSCSVTSTLLHLRALWPHSLQRPWPFCPVAAPGAGHPVDPPRAGRQPECWTWHRAGGRTSGVLPAFWILGRVGPATRVPVCRPGVHGPGTGARRWPACRAASTTRRPLRGSKQRLAGLGGTGVSPVSAHSGILAGTGAVQVGRR